MFHLPWGSIQVYDGKKKNDTVLGIFSGTRRQPFIVQTSGRFMMLTLDIDLSTPCYFKGAYYASSKKGY